MEWFEDIKSYKLVPITTGDGVTYELKMKFKGGSIEPLTKSYNYPGKVGTKPKRNSSASPVYDLLVYIEQDNWNAFKDSISDPAAEWLVKHPLYGDLKGLPTAINWDNTKLGNVEFTFQFQQGIPDDIPAVKIDYKAEVGTTNTAIQTQAIDDVGELEFTEVEKNFLSDLIDSLEAIYDTILNNEYINVLYDIRAVINAATFDSYRFMDLFNDMLNIGSRLYVDIVVQSDVDIFGSSVKKRNAIMTSQNAAILEASSESITLASFKEYAGACNMTALAATVVTPLESTPTISGYDVTDTTEVITGNDYKYNKDVISAIDEVNTLYDNYINTISALDIIEGIQSFTPDDGLTENVTKTILLAIQEIKDISNKAKTENIYTTISDTTPELLAFELYGSATDENVESIIDDNDLLGRETLENSWRNMIIRKGVNIVYYV